MHAHVFLSLLSWLPLSKLATLFFNHGTGVVLLKCSSDGAGDNRQGDLHKGTGELFAVVDPDGPGLAAVSGRGASGRSDGMGMPPLVG
jgi:hypothetical protein